MSSCTGFLNPITTEIIVLNGINSGDGKLSNTWTAKYFDYRGLNATGALEVTAPVIAYTNTAPNYDAKYSGTANGCYATIRTAINTTTGDITVTSTKTNMFTHLSYLVSIFRSAQ